jgi:hypothetical protein
MTPAPKRRRFRDRFVVDGFLRAQAAAEPEIRFQVIGEYSEQLEAAGFWGRFWLRRTIDREVRIRLNQVAPPGALY